MSTKPVVIVNGPSWTVGAWVRSLAKLARTELDWIGYGNIAEVYHAGDSEQLPDLNAAITQLRNQPNVTILQRIVNGILIPGEQGQLLAVVHSTPLDLEELVKCLQHATDSRLSSNHWGTHGEIFNHGDYNAQTRAFTTIGKLKPTFRGRFIRCYHPQTGEVIS